MVAKKAAVAWAGDEVGWDARKRQRSHAKIGEKGTKERRLWDGFAAPDSSDDRKEIRKRTMEGGLRSGSE